MSHNRVLCVAEKPTVEKSIANILFRPQQAQSLRTHSVYNPKYEFQCSFEGRNVTMIVTSVTGHLMETDFDDAHRKWHSCDPRQLLDLSTLVHRRVPHEKSALKDTLEELARSCGTLVCCLDGDREGENISFEVLPLPRKLPRTNGVTRTSAWQAGATIHQLLWLVFWRKNSHQKWRRALIGTRWLRERHPNPFFREQPRAQLCFCRISQPRDRVICGGFV